MKVLIVKQATTLSEVTEEQLQAIRSASGNAEIVVAESSVEAAPHFADAEILLGSINAAEFATAKKLRWVHAVSSGADALLFPELVASDVSLTSEKGLVGEHLADHAFALLLALVRQIPRAVLEAPSNWKSRIPMRQQMIELNGSTLGIVGLGGTGRAVAMRAKAFGMDVLAVDSEEVPPAAEVAEVWPADRLHEMLGLSDVVVVCCPLTPLTRSLFNDEAFAAMKRTAYLINVTRGPIVDNDAIVRAMQQGRIAGAGLDVTPIEPLPEDHPLWKFPNVLITPHTAGASQARIQRNVGRFVENLRRYREGAALEGEIDKLKGF